MEKEIEEKKKWKVEVFGKIMGNGIYNIVRKIKYY